jgi:uncharacterized membrane protein YoaK (UPF0700 family)
LTAQEALAAVLALIAGYVDAYTFLNYQVYGSFMSGNTTQTGLHAGKGGFAVAGYNLLPIPLFVAGVFAGTLIWHSALAQASRWLFALVAGLLALGLAAVAPGPLPGWVGIMVLSLTMGIMNTTVTRVGEQQISLGYVTGTLNNFAQHLALAVKGAPLSHAEGPHDTHLRRAGRGDVGRLRHRRLARRRRDAKFCCLEPAVAHSHSVGPRRSQPAVPQKMTI